MRSLRKIAENISDLFKSHAQRVYRASLFVKIALVLGGTLCAGIAEAFEIAGDISVLTVIVLAGIVFAFIGGVYAAATDTDVSNALDTARQAIEEA
jgi:hypothetical protein